MSQDSDGMTLMMVVMIMMIMMVVVVVVWPCWWQLQLRRCWLVVEADCNADTYKVRYCWQAADATNQWETCTCMHHVCQRMPV
jgi:hypothetical protein